MLQLAWRYGGEDPFRLYHMLDGHYTPWEGGEAHPPCHPLRLRSFIYACARVSLEDDAALAGGKVS